MPCHAQRKDPRPPPCQEKQAAMLPARQSKLPCCLPSKQAAMLPAKQSKLPCCLPSKSCYHAPADTAQTQQHGRGGQRAWRRGFVNHLELRSHCGFGRTIPRSPRTMGTPPIDPTYYHRGTWAPTSSYVMVIHLWSKGPTIPQTPPVYGNYTRIQFKKSTSRHQKSISGPESPVFPSGKNGRLRRPDENTSCIIDGSLYNIEHHRHHDL